MLRTIHIGLQSVQQSPEDRPKMSSVVLIFVSKGESPMPIQPDFLTERNASELGSDTMLNDQFS